MKTIISLFFAILLPWLLYAQKTQKFFITGKIKGMRHGYIYIDYPQQNGEWGIDSCAIQKRKFSFSGNINETTLGFIRIGNRFCADDDPNAASLYIAPDKMEVTLRHNHAKSIKVTGSPMQLEKDSLNRILASIIILGRNTAERINNAASNFIIKHPHSYVSAFQLALYSSIWDVDTVINLYNNLDTNIQNSFYGREVKKIKDAISDNSEGKPAKVFTATSLDGTDVNLSSFKGRPVLIDFWASWCLPCHKALPHIKSIYSQYHSKGLEIVSVSCDDDLQAWKAAIEKDSTSIWYNVLSNYKNNTVVTNNPPTFIKDMYAVYGIPVVVIIDRNGIIAGRYTGDDEQTSKDIDEKLKEVMR